jgi:hypothetical protein
LIAGILLRFTKRNPLMFGRVRLSGPLLTSDNKTNPVITDALNQHFSYLCFSPSSLNNFLEFKYISALSREGLLY